MNSKLLNLDLDTIAAYNDHGKNLVKAIKEANIPSIHHPVILGMFAVYSLVTSIGHFDSSEVHWPPHSLELFDPQKWLDAGLAPDADSVISLLPYLKEREDEQEGWHLAPEAEALSYLGDIKYEHECEDLQPEPYIAQRCFDFVGRDLVRTDHVRLTGGREFANFYIYDTTSGKMMILNKYTYEEVHKNDHYTTHPDLSFHPAQTIVKNWIRNLLTLIYTPYPLSCDPRAILDLGYRTFPGEPFEWDPQTGAQRQFPHPSVDVGEQCQVGPRTREETVYWAAMRRRDVRHVVDMRGINRGYGWPDSFDREGCRAALEKLHEEFRGRW